MPRSVNTVASRRRRKKIMKLAKGYFGRKKNVWTVAKNQVEKGWVYAYRDRRAKKREFRRLWIQRINAAARLNGLTYSTLMGKLHSAGILLNRKVLADMAMNHADAFVAICQMATDGKVKAAPAAKKAEKPIKEAKPKAEKKEEKAAKEAPVEEAKSDDTNSEEVSKEVEA